MNVTLSLRKLCRSRFAKNVALVRRQKFRNHSAAPFAVSSSQLPLRVLHGHHDCPACQNKLRLLTVVPRLRVGDARRPMSSSTAQDKSASRYQFHTKEFKDLLETYSKFQPCPVSMAHFIDFGRSANLETSYLFLKREVPIRIANIMKELQFMPEELKKTDGCQLVTSQYAQSFKEMVGFENLSAKDADVLKDFTANLTAIRDRHADTVISMAGAIMQSQSEWDSSGGSSTTATRPRFEKNIQYFLDRLYTARISTRMLINQHTLLFDETRRKRNIDGRKMHMVGSIDPECEIAPVVMQAYQNARFLCEQYYMTAPSLEYRAIDASRKNGGDPVLDENGEHKISIVYVPSHLYHILFELFKNAMRATVEFYGEESLRFPPIKVLVVKGKEDLTIKVRDRGGGIPRSLIERIFEYLYTTASKPVVTNSAEIFDFSSALQESLGSGAGTVPLAGLGYGLPLSRLYARYFDGDLVIHSTEGYGTDAMLYLHSQAGEAKERLPIYHELGSKKIYEAQLTASDWTGVDQQNKRKLTGHGKDINDL